MVRETPVLAIAGLILAGCGSRTGDSGALIADAGISLLPAIPIGFLVGGVMGVILEVTLIRRMYHRPLDTLLVTWRVALICNRWPATSSGRRTWTSALQLAVRQCRPRYHAGAGCPAVHPGVGGGHRGRAFLLLKATPLGTPDPRSRAEPWTWPRRSASPPAVPTASPSSSVLACLGSPVWCSPCSVPLGPPWAPAR